MTLPLHLPDIDGLLSETEMTELHSQFIKRCEVLGLNAEHADAAPIFFDILSSFLSGWSGKPFSGSADDLVLASWSPDSPR